MKNIVQLGHSVALFLLLMVLFGEEALAAPKDHSAIVKTGSGYNAATWGYDDTREADDETFHVTRNRNGAILKSETATIYFGKSCDAFSPEYGRGTWGWENGGFVAVLERKTIGFPRQDNPVGTQRCKY